MNGSPARRWQAPELDPAPQPPSAPAEPVRIGPSVEELAAIEKAAREEGYAAGHAEGLAAGQAEVQRLQDQLAALLRSLAAPLAELDQQVAEALGALAVRIAGALLQEAYEADPERLARLVHATLEIAGRERSGAELRMHPADLERVAPLLADETLRLVADPELHPGDVRVHGSSLRVDASLETRLRSAYAALRADADQDVPS